MTFHSPSVWFLLLLPLALLPLVAHWRRTRRSTVAFGSLAAVADTPSGLAARLRALPAVFRSLAIALVVIALARPVIPNESARKLVEGVAIQMVVDRSDSMRALDFSIGGEPANRLDALKDIARKFIAGGDGFAGRPNDLVGVVMFARNADSVVPLTLDREVVLDALEQVRFPEGSEEQGTAIGDAIALGVEKLKDAADRANRDGRTRIKSKVLVLLTDGESNAGELAPLDAAALAKSTDTRVYTIGLGTRGLAPVPVRTPFGTQIQQVPVSIDEKTLTAIADATGGRYFRATDSNSLKKIYETIDALEKSSIEETKTVRYRELAVEPFPSPLPLLPASTVPPVLLWALAALFIETLLSTTVLRRLG